MAARIGVKGFFEPKYSRETWRRLEEVGRGIVTGSEGAIWEIFSVEALDQGGRVMLDVKRRG